LTTFENYQILLHKISQIFLPTTKLVSGWKSKTIKKLGHV